MSLFLQIHASDPEANPPEAHAAERASRETAEEYHQQVAVALAGALEPFGVVGFGLKAEARRRA